MTGPLLREELDGYREMIAQGATHEEEVGAYLGAYLGYLVDFEDMGRAILEELRGLRADYARVSRALEVVVGTNPLSLGGEGISTTTYAREVVTAPGSQGPGVVTSSRARSTNPLLRRQLDAEYAKARKRYPRPTEEELDRLDAIHAEVTGRRPLVPAARGLLGDAVQVHGSDRTGELLRDWYRARGTADDLLLYLRTTRDPFEEVAAPSAGAPPSATGTPEEDGAALDDFSGVDFPERLEVRPSPPPYSRPSDPREGPPVVNSFPASRRTL